MAGAPPDGFASGGPTAVAATPRERADDDGDFGHIDTAPVVAPAVGVTIGRYRLEALLGEGAMGQVWRARDPQLDRAVAIKVVHPTIAANPESSARLLREARAMAKLSHGNVVTVHDAGDDQGRLFVAMDLVDGVSLGARLRARPPGAARDWRGILAVFRDAGRGLIAAHAAGVLHRDFKPDNVLVDGAGRARVADFGLAVFGARPEPARRPSTAGSDAVASDLTAAGSVLGTPAYMSPEQLRGEVIDARADQFSFCASLFEALYGAPAFLRDEPMTIAALVTAIEDGAVRPAPADDPVPRWVRAAVVRGLAADPAARWPDMGALVAALIPPRRVPPVMIGLSLGAVAVAALAVIVVLRADRGGRHAAAPVEATRRFEVSLASRLAISPDGRRVALATPDRIDVRDLDGGQTWSRFAAGHPIHRVEFVDGDRLRFGQTLPFAVVEWTPSTDATRELWRRADWERWLGQLDGQDVLARQRPGGWTLGLAAPGAGEVRELAQLEGQVPVAVGSPDRRRLALLLERRYDGQVALLGPGGVEARSAWIPALTAVHWLDDRTLIYATGTVDLPTLWAAPLIDGAVGPPRRLYQRPRGWFGQLAVAADRVLFIDSGATFRSRVLDRRAAGASARELDPAVVGATLAWLDDATFVTWNRASGQLERHQLTGPVGATPARLDGEVVNATRADDVIIAALRRDTGRELVAVSLTDGRELWRRPAGFGRGVRCADDAAPPCAVIHDGEGDDQRLAWIDPRTGAVGPTFGAPGRVDDVALTRGGAEALIADGTRQLKRVDLASGAVTPIEVGVAPRALAADPRGGVLVTGTRVVTQYVLLRIDGTTTEELMQSRDDLLFLPRPSPGGGAISVMGRLFLPALYELPRHALR